MWNEESKNCEALKEGDVAGIALDFDSNRALFFKNGKLQVALDLENSQLKEWEIFGCVIVSDGTTVEIENPTEFPKHLKGII